MILTMDGMPRLLRRWLLAGGALGAVAMPTAALLPQAASASGSARLLSGRACVTSRGFLATVSGEGIESVAFKLDGRKVKTLKVGHAGGSVSLRIRVTPGGTHLLSIRVTFTAASNTRPVMINRTLARCAAKRRVAPRFTG
jgi:hypothetical protein